MNLPVMLIGGAIAYLFVSNKNTPKSTSSIITRPGYKIKNCNSFIIENKTEAAWYAFKQGLNHTSEKEMLNTIFGGSKCIEKFDGKSEKDLDFIYTLFLYYFAGGFSQNKLIMENIKMGLLVMRNQIALAGIDTSKWYTEENIKPIIAAYNNGQSENI